MDKFQGYFAENNDGKGSDAEKAVSYVVVRRALLSAALPGFS